MLWLPAGKDTDERLHVCTGPHVSAMKRRLRHAPLCSCAHSCAVFDIAKFLHRPEVGRLLAGYGIDVTLHVCTCPLRGAMRRNPRHGPLRSCVHCCATSRQSSCGTSFVRGPEVPCGAAGWQGHRCEITYSANGGMAFFTCCWAVSSVMDKPAQYPEVRCMRTDVWWHGSRLQCKARQAMLAAPAVSRMLPPSWPPAARDPFGTLLKQC